MQSSVSLADFTSQADAKLTRLASKNAVDKHGWSSWKSDISRFQSGRELLLEIDLLTMHKEMGAVRLSSFAPGKDDALVEMPPLAELEGTASDTEH